MIGTLIANRFRVDGRLYGLPTGAEVYVGADTKSNVVVHIEVLRLDLMTPVQQARWDRQVVALETIAHPSIRRLLHHEQSVEQVLLVLEPVAGSEGPETLAKVYAGTGLPVDAFTSRGRAIIDGLVAIHAAGFVHGDLSAECIFLRPDQSIAIGGFGCIRATGAPTSDSNWWEGCCETTAPEVVTSGTRSEASDAYSLGAVLFRLATGQYPFPAEQSPSVWAMGEAHVHQIPPPLSDRRLDIEPELRELILSWLGKVPESRATLRQAQAIWKGGVPVSAGGSAGEVAAEDPHDGIGWAVWLLLAVVSAAAYSMMDPIDAPQKPRPERTENTDSGQGD